MRPFRHAAQTPGIIIDLEAGPEHEVGARRRYAPSPRLARFANLPTDDLLPDDMPRGPTPRPAFVRRPGGRSSNQVGPQHQPPLHRTTAEHAYLAADALDSGYSHRGEVYDLTI